MRWLSNLRTGMCWLSNLRAEVSRLPHAGPKRASERPCCIDAVRELELRINGVNGVD
jgi:hypothetical protein